tara:strand:+ start:98 stop:901 length:804 start_codon:yes stop_codon:yes gene_type:complete
MNEISIIDTHCHLDFNEFKNRLDQVIKDAKINNVTDMVTISTNLSRIETIREISEKYEEIFFTVGVHPNEAHKDKQFDDYHFIKNYSKHEKCVGIGEGGLDYYYNKKYMELQKRSLEVQISVARSANLPMIIHSRDADNDMIEIIKSEYKNGPFKAILHCYSSGEELAYCGLDLDFFISFSGILTFNSAKNIQKLAKNIPLNKILVETDSPYLAPTPVRGSVNEPKNCIHTAQFLSKLRGINFLELSETLYKNSLSVYDKIKIWKNK